MLLVGSLVQLNLVDLKEFARLNNKNCGGVVVDLFRDEATSRCPGLKWRTASVVDG